MTIVHLQGALYVIEIAGIVAFALSGVIEGARRKLDAVGVCVVAGLAAFGGGTLRDVLLDRRPFFWVEHTEFLWLVLAVAVLAMMFMRGRHFELTERSMQYPDALGLGLFAASGTQLALMQDLPAIVCVLMGVLTAVFGGVLRDMVCNDIPKVFKDHQPYALCAFAGAWVLVWLHHLGVESWAGLLMAAGVTAGLRIVAIVWDVRIKPWRTEL